MAFESGTISKYDVEGNKLADYAPDQFARPHIMESWASLRLFVFFENTQQYTFLDRFLSGAQLNQLPPTLGFISLATSTSNNQLWLIDERGFRLIRYDFEFDQIVLERSFNQLPQALDLKPYQIKEYQNRLYVGDKAKGILVFDNLGNFLNIIEAPAVHFDFIDEQLYYLQGDQLVLHHLYDGHFKTIPLPLRNCSLALLLDNHLILIKDQWLKSYAYKP